MAFEQLVQQQDDLEGLLAYAFYKQTLHDRSKNGMPVAPSALRALAGTEIATYRIMATTILKVFESAVIAKEKDNIISSGVLSVTQAIKQHVDSRTSVKTAVWWGFVAGVLSWIFSLTLTVLLALAAPEKAQAVAKALGLGP